MFIFKKAAVQCHYTFIPGRYYLVDSIPYRNTYCHAINKFGKIMAAYCEWFEDV